MKDMAFWKIWLSGTGNHKKNRNGTASWAKKKLLNEILVKFGLENGIYSSPFKIGTENSPMLRLIMATRFSSLCDGRGRVNYIFCIVNSVIPAHSFGKILTPYTFCVYLWSCPFSLFLLSPFPCLLEHYFAAPDLSRERCSCRSLDRIFEKDSYIDSWSVRQKLLVKSTFKKYPLFYHS